MCGSPYSLILTSTLYIYHHERKTLIGNMEMPDDVVRFGIIGCVRSATKIARAITLSSNSTIHAVGDEWSVETAKQFVVSNGLPDTVTVYGSYDRVLDDPGVDAVYLPFPPARRLRWAVAAAEKKKHLLIEKPAAVDVEELDRILEACRSNGVQFMDATIWLHHSRTAKIKEMMFDSGVLGDVHHIHTTMTASIPESVIDKITSDTLGSAGAIGELGWYPISSVLWAKGYRIPTSVKAIPSTVTRNSSGLIMSCTASLQFDHPNNQTLSTVAVIHCSFRSHLSMDLTITGSRGTVRMGDFVIPYQEESAWFEFTAGARFLDMHIGWNTKAEKVTVSCDGEPQEVVMVGTFARLVDGIKTGRSEADRSWDEISRKTQVVVDAVKKSIDLGGQSVFL